MYGRQELTPLRSSLNARWNGSEGRQPTVGVWAGIEGNSRSGMFLTELSRRRCVPDRPDTRVSPLATAILVIGHGRLHITRRHLLTMSSGGMRISRMANSETQMIGRGPMSMGAGAARGSAKGGWSGPIAAAPQRYCMRADRRQVRQLTNWHARTCSGGARSGDRGSQRTAVVGVSRGRGRSVACATLPELGSARPPFAKCTNPRNA